jgi:hypothetical protein
LLSLLLHCYFNLIFVVVVVVLWSWA